MVRLPASYEMGTEGLLSAWSGQKRQLLNGFSRTDHIAITEFFIELF
jgi:hypothetical protein